MKKITLFFGMILAFAGAANTQTQIDTVFLRYVEWKGEEWWWNIAALNPHSMDSVNKKQYKKLIRSIELANPASATNFTYDSLPGNFAMIFYDEYWRHPEARENMGQGIATRLQASPQLAPYIATEDAARLERFNQRKREGRLTTN